MKILRLHIQNLNSLKGDHTVDFTTGPLAESGIFAIVGPTGAGKTTLLDAITLALYGRIDRDPDKRGGGKAVMSFGTNACFAELEYATSSGLYRSRWERWRAHQKADGNLLGPKRYLEQYDDEAGQFVGIGEKISEIDAQTEAITGLDYERFTRSVMLTQGEFARFLKAAEKDRAALLETITGTEIYRQLSTAAFEKHKLVLTKYQQLREQLNQLQLLTETEKEAAVQGINDLKAKANITSAELKRLRTELANYKDLAILQTEISKDQDALKVLQQKHEQASAARKKLAASDALGPLQDQLRQLEQLLLSEKDITQELKVLTANLHQLKADGKHLHAQVSNNEEKLNTFLEKKQERQEKINLAIRLEAEQKSLASTLDKYQAEAKQLAAEQQAVQTQQKQLEQEIRSLSDAGSQLDTALQAAIGQPQVRKNVEENVLLLATRIATLEVQISQQQQQIDQLALVQNMIASEKTLQRLAQELQSVQAQSAAQAAKLQQIKTDLTYQRELREQQLQSEALVRLRTDLKPAEPCPVCGSMDHPALAHWKPPTASALARTKQAVEQLEKDLSETEKAWQRVQEQLATIKAKSVAETERLTHLGKQLSTDRDALLALSKTQEETQLAAKQDELTKLKKLAAQLQTAKDARQRLVTAQEQLKTLQNQATNLAPKLLSLQEQSTTTTTALAENRQAIQALLNGLTAAAAAQQLREHEQRCRTLAQKASQALNDHQQQLARQEEKTSGLATRKQEVAEEAEKLTTSLTTAVNALGYSTTAEATMALLPLEKAQNIRASLTELDQKLHSLEAQVKRNLEKADRLHKAAAQLPPETRLIKSLNETEALAQNQQQQIGALQEKIRIDQANRSQAGKWTSQLPRLEKEVNRWALLDELIGQKDGTKFSRFAQGLTLGRLLQLANRQLAILSGRYRLDRQVGSDLELEIIDTYQADNRRPTATLSGGESFLVSLALALGLSDLAGGNTQIQSLFIDEGFGTLDSKALDLVISALENLRASGKTIGLISHVPALRERIYHKISVLPKGDGFSKLELI